MRGKGSGIGGGKSSATLGYTEMQEDIFDNEVAKAEFDEKVQYMCYGDTIMLNYTHKVF